MENKELTREELKIMALRERVATLTTDYEDKVADLRVELTLVAQERDALKSQLEGEPDVPATDEG